MEYPKEHCEYLRLQAKQKFDKVRESWIECGRWALPHRIKWMQSQTQGARTNQHIVDPTHILALRSYVSGFLEGNTSASRPWARFSHQDPDLNRFPKNREWLDKFAGRCFYYLSQSNFYHAAGAFYYDYGVFNTGAYYVDELDTGLHWHILEPGAYYVLNNAFGVGDVLVREFSLDVEALVTRYGKKKDGKWDWSNFSSRVRKMYEDGNKTQKIDIVHVIKRNESYDANYKIVGQNRQWCSLTYELGGSSGQYYQDGQEFGASVTPGEEQIYLKISHTTRKPFIIGRSESSNNFEYGEKGPTLDALGCIKSLNKKAISKDIAMEQMLKPAVQGPASLRKSYITTAPNAFVPLDAQSIAQGGLKPIMQINPAVATINADVSDLRSQVDRLYFADYLLYLTQNPKTRTARETDAVVDEQQRIIGPNLQSLNYTHNVPVMEYIMKYVLENDPYLDDPPEDLQGESVKLDFISVFAQAQKAADLPAIERYKAMVIEVAQLNPKIWDKINLDKLADIYEDRLFLPAGLNRAQGDTDAIREQAVKEQQRQQLMQETIPALAGAAKDVRKE